MEIVYMYSLKELFKIGHGPSSSHTMGPAYAVEIFKKKYPNCDHVNCILKGSLALTGKGHLTDYVIKEIERDWLWKNAYAQNANLKK